MWGKGISVLYSGFHRAGLDLRYDCGWKEEYDEKATVALCVDLIGIKEKWFTYLELHDRILL